MTNLTGRHLRIREDAVRAQACELPFARLLHARTNLYRAFSRRAFARQLFEANGGHVNVYIYAVEQRPTDAPDVALNLQRRATTFARRVVPETTRLRVYLSPRHASIFR